MIPISRPPHFEEPAFLCLSTDDIFQSLPLELLSEFYPPRLISILADYEKERNSPQPSPHFRKDDLLELFFTRFAPSNESGETAPPPYPGSAPKEVLLRLPPTRSANNTTGIRFDDDVPVALYHHLDFLYAFSQIPKPSIQAAYQSIMHSSHPTWLKTCCLLIWLLDNQHEFAYIESLTLHAGVYKLTELPPTLLKYLPNLKALTATGHRIRELDVESLPPGLKHLDLSKNQIRELVIPPHGPSLPPVYFSLEQIILSENKLDPYYALSDFSIFRNLKALFLEHNEIRETRNVPIYDLQKLERLSLAHNELRRLENIRNLPSLEFLDVSYNNLSLGLELDALPKLLCLDISHNNLEYVKTYNPFPSCAYVNISNNPILIYNPSVQKALFDSFPSLERETPLSDLMNPPVFISCSVQFPIEELIAQAPPPVEVAPLQYSNPFTPPSAPPASPVNVPPSPRTTSSSPQEADLIPCSSPPMDVDQPAPVKIDPIQHALASIELVRLISTENPRLEEIYNRVLSEQKDPVNPVDFMDDFYDLLRSNRYVCLQIKSISNLGREPFQHKLTFFPDFLQLFEKLEALVLVDQAITSLKSLPSYPKLQLLNLDGNDIATLNDLPNLPSLRILALANNKIARFEELLKLLPFPIIEACHLEGNPIAETIRPGDKRQFTQLFKNSNPAVTLHWNSQEKEEEQLLSLSTSPSLPPPITEVDEKTLKLREEEEANDFLAFYLNVFCEYNAFCQNAFKGAEMRFHNDPIGAKDYFIGCIERGTFGETFLDQIRYVFIDRSSNSRYRIKHFPTILAGMTAVEMLKLSDQELSSFEGLPSTPSLKALVLDFNNIRNFSHFPHLPNLESLSLTHNQIADLEGIEAFNQNTPQLKRLVLYNNPITASALNNPSYLRRLEELFNEKRKVPLQLELFDPLDY